MGVERVGRRSGNCSEDNNGENDSEAVGQGDRDRDMNVEC